MIGSNFRDSFALLALVDAPDGQGGHTRSFQIVEDKQFIHGRQVPWQPPQEYLREARWNDLEHCRIILNGLQTGDFGGEFRVKDRRGKLWDIIAYQRLGPYVLLSCRYIPPGEA